VRAWPVGGAANAALAPIPHSAAAASTTPAVLVTMIAYTAYRLMWHAEVRSVRLYDAPPRVPGPRAGP